MGKWFGTKQPVPVQPSGSRFKGGHKVTIHAGAPKNPCDDHAKAIPTAAPVISQDVLEATVIGQGCVRVKTNQGPKIYNVATSALEYDTWRNLKKSCTGKKAPRRHQEERVHASNADGVEQSLLNKTSQGGYDLDLVR